MRNYQQKNTERNNDAGDSLKRFATANQDKRSDKVTLGKEMTPDSFNGTDRMKFSDWEYEHSGRVTSWSGSRRNRRMCPKTGSTRSQCSEDGPGKQETARGGTPHREKRATQRRSERLEKAAHGIRASDQCDSIRIHEEITGNFWSKDDIRRERTTNA